MRCAVPIVALTACVARSPHGLLVEMRRDDPTGAQLVYAIVIHQDGTVIEGGTRIGALAPAQVDWLRNKLAALPIASLRTAYVDAACTSLTAHGSDIAISLLADGRIKVVYDDHRCQGPPELIALRVFERSVERLLEATTGRRLPRWQDDARIGEPQRSK